MKTLKLLFILPLLFLFFSFSYQNNTEINLSSGKWHVDSIQLGENIIDINNEIGNQHWVLFEKNNKYKDYNNTGDNHSWKYNAKDNTIIISIDSGTLIKKLIHVDENELIISTPIDGSEDLITFMRKL